MPAHPRWFSHIDRIRADLAALEDPWMDRQAVQQLLGVQTRRAQQIMAPCLNRMVGTSGLVHRDRLMAHLGSLAAGEGPARERQRRKRLAATLAALRRLPKLPVEAPASVSQQRIASLPSGVELSPGRIVVRFAHPREALEKLLALAMAAGNDYSLFEQLTSSQL